MEDSAGDVGRGREHYRLKAWVEAYGSLSRADGLSPLGAEDLELLAVAAYLIGRDAEYLDALDRAYRAHLAAESKARAARCAFSIGLRFLLRGEAGRATAWHARAGRLLEHMGGDCVERGYVLVTVADQRLRSGDAQGAFSIADAAADAGDRFGEPDLVAIARHLQGQVRLHEGRVKEGLAFLDEAMLAVTAGELRPSPPGSCTAASSSAVAVCTRWSALGSGPRPWRAGATDNPRWSRSPEPAASTGRRSWS